MCNHVHILLEVPPLPAGGISDAELLKRLRAIYSGNEVKEVEKELAKARQAIAEGRADEAYAQEIHARFTYRMHDLGQYMKTLLGRFCLRSAQTTPNGRASSGAPGFVMAA